MEIPKAIEVETLLNPYEGLKLSASHLKGASHILLKRS